jgi:thiamine biosynthesis lipoprotein
MTAWTEPVMGDHPFTIEVAGPADPAVIEAAFAELRRIERIFSPFRTDSAVSALNAGTLCEAEAEPLVRDVLASCRRFERATDGYFSAWAAGQLDPCGLVKGWAIGRAATILERAGYRDYFVDGAGDVFVRGERGPGRPWRVGIRHPRERERVVAVVEARDTAVATSGTYEKGAHIVDPHTGRPATELVSLTIIGPDIVAADVYATAAFAMGRDGLAFIEGVPGYEALAIDAELYCASTSGFEERIAA